MPRFPRFYRWLLDQEYAWLRIMLLALIVRLGMLVLLADEPLVSDGYYYHQAVLQFVEQGHLDPYWPPGLPLYEAAWVWLFGNGEIWMRVAMLPFFFWLCRSFYGIAYRLHSRVAANIGLLMLSLYPAMVHQSLEPLSYLPAAAILLAIFGHTQAYLEERHRGRLWRMGLLIGLLILMRPASAIFLLALPPLILLRRRKFLPGLVLVLFAALVVGPWIWLTSKQNDRFIWINDANSRNFYLGNNAWTPGYKTWYYGSHWSGEPGIPQGFQDQLAAIEKLPPKDQGRAYTHAAQADMAARPGAFLWRTASRIRTLLAFDTLGGARLQHARHPLAPLGTLVLAVEALFYITLGCAFLLFWFSEVRRELAGSTLAMISGFLVVYALPYWFSFSHPNYHLPMLALMLLPGAVWMRHFLENGGHFPAIPKKNRWKLGLSLLIFVAIQVEWVIQMLLMP